MEDLFSLIKIIRKVEALFLPLFPGRFQEIPPTYRLGSIWIEKLRKHENEPGWKSALHYYIKNYVYRAYHEKGLASQGRLSETEIKWMRYILAIMGIVIVISFIPQAKLISPLIKAILLLGSSILIIFGSSLLSISAIWASWGFLFRILGPTSLGSAPWTIFFLSVWVLIWHVPALKKNKSFQWYDLIATLPVLFFWMDMIKWVPSWTHCQNGYISIFVWSCLWACLIWTKMISRVSVALQLFWPSSLLCFFVIAIWGKAFFSEFQLFQNWRWLLWLAGAFSLSLLIAQIYPTLAAFKALFHFHTYIIVFLVFGISIFFFGNLDFLSEQIDYSVSLLSGASWPLWWFIGAGIIMLIRKYAMILLNWVQAILPSWLLPLSLLAFPAAALYFDWLPFLIQAVGKELFLMFAVCLSLISCIFAWRKNEKALRECIFWSLYVIFLLQRHWSSAHRMAYESNSELSLTGFILLSLWLMWLGYDSIGEKLGEFGKKEQDRRKIVALMGAFLWILTSSLWTSYIDNNLSILLEINLNLFMGFNFFGCPLIIYKLIIGERMNMDTSHMLPWPWIILVGIGFVQLLQGIEHYLVAFIQGWTIDELHLNLHGVYVDLSKPVESLLPAWVLAPSWNFLCRFERWLAAMSMIIVLTISIKEKNNKYMARLLSITCLTSLAAGVTESYWFQWPSMSSFWSVIFRPWQIDKTLLSWGIKFLEFFALYAIAGIAWGLLFFLIQQVNILKKKI